MSDLQCSAQGFRFGQTDGHGLSRTGEGRGILGEVHWSKKHFAISQASRRRQPETAASRGNMWRSVMFNDPWFASSHLAILPPVQGRISSACSAERRRVAVSHCEQALQALLSIHSKTWGLWTKHSYRCSPICHILAIPCNGCPCHLSNSCEAEKSRGSKLEVLALWSFTTLSLVLSTESSSAQDNLSLLLLFAVEQGLEQEHAMCACLRLCVWVCACGVYEFLYLCGCVCVSSLRNKLRAKLCMVVTKRSKAIPPHFGWRCKNCVLHLHILKYIVFMVGVNIWQAHG